MKEDDDMNAVNKLTNTWPDSWVTCRTIGHSWKPINAERKPSWGTLLVIQCVNCHTKREDTINRFGEVSTRNYIHPDGYLIPGKREDKPNRMQYRRVLISRMNKGK